MSGTRTYFMHCLVKRIDPSFVVCGTTEQLEASFGALAELMKDPEFPSITRECINHGRGSVLEKDHHGDMYSTDAKRGLDAFNVFMERRNARDETFKRLRAD